MGFSGSVPYRGAPRFVSPPHGLGFEAIRVQARCISSRRHVKTSPPPPVKPNGGGRDADNPGSTGPAGLYG